MSTTKNNLRFKQPLKNAVVKVKEPLTQQKLDNGLELKDAPQPVLNKIKSEVKIIDYKKKKEMNDIVVNLKQELIYKRDLEEKQKFPKGKFIIVIEPERKQEFYIFRLKECLNPKRGIAWGDFFDITAQSNEFRTYSLDEEGLVKWEHMLAVLNFKVKPGEVVSQIKLSPQLCDKVYLMMGIKKQNKRDSKQKAKIEESKYDDSEATIKVEESGDEYQPEDLSSDESVDLLPSDEDDDEKPKKKKKFGKRAKKTPAMKAAIEAEKRINAEKAERESKNTGILIKKTRITDDGLSIEEVEIDPIDRESRPRKWKFVQRPEENKEMDIIHHEIMRFSLDSNLLYLENSMTTANRNIIRAALTNNAHLAKKCIEEVNLLSSLMEPWSPEIKSTALEIAISRNSLSVLELLLDVCKEEETQIRCQEQKLLISKFDTGQVSDRAFGTRVRKVEMMRGGRQGNNAFMQDIKRKEDCKSMLEQLNNDEVLSVRVAYSCNIELTTLRLIFEKLGNQALPFFKNTFYHIMRTGRRHLAAECLEIIRRIGEQEDKDAITDEMIKILLMEKEIEKNDNKSKMKKGKANQIDNTNKKSIDIQKLDKKHQFKGIGYLHFACINPNCLELIKELLNNGYSLNFKDKHECGALPILYAAANSNIEIFKFIVGQDSQYLRVYDKKDNTPLIIAIIAKRVNNIHYMLQLVPTCIKDKSILRMTPLSVACRNGDVAVTKTLMSYKGSSPNQPGGWEKLTPLCYASSYGYYPLVEFIIQFTKAKIDKGDKFGRTPLMLACRNGHIKIASLLLKYGANIKAEDTSGNCALHYAAAYGFPECVDLLLENNADVNAQNLWKSTPLSIAMLKRNLVCVNQLLDKAKNINADVKDDNGNTLLSIAVESMSEGNMNLIDRILKDADPNIPDAQGNTPLIKVIYRITEKLSQKKKIKKIRQSIKLEVEVVKKLIKKGADPAIKNKAGQNAVTLIMQTNETSNALSKSAEVSELIQLLWKEFSFINDPKAFFSFNKNILSESTQSMILSFIKKSIKENENNKSEDIEMKSENEDEEEQIVTSKEGQLPTRIINILDDEGYTPFLRYIKEFTVQGKNIYDKIEKYVISNGYKTDEDCDKIDLPKILQESKNAPGLFQNNQPIQVFGFGNQNVGLFNQQNPFGGFNQPQGLFGGFNQPVVQNNQQNKQKEIALKYFDENICKPFTEFLKELVNFGANPHACIEKLKDYRDYEDNGELRIRKRDSFGKIMNEYCNAGLSNALHLILDFPSKTIFDFLIDSQITTEEININKMTPFFALIKSKDTTLPEYKYCLDKFLSTKADIDSPDQFGISAFWYCYQNKKIDLALYLASKGADINRLDNYGFFALKSEVFNNNLDRIKQLINAGANINNIDEFQRTVLHHTFNRFRTGNDLAIGRYLMANGADINAKDFKKRTPLHYLFVKSNRRRSHEPSDPNDMFAECINLCNNITINEGDNNGNTVLHYMCQRNSVSCMRLLKPKITSKDFEKENRDGNTVFGTSLVYRHSSMASYLIQNFDIDLNGYVYKPLSKKNDGGNVQGEESDFEFMEIEDPSAEELQERIKTRKTYFEFCVMKQELNLLVKLFLEKGYSISKAFTDAFKAGNYQQLFQLISSMNSDNVKEAIKMKDDKGRNLFHSLSKAPENTAFVDICKKLIEEFHLDPSDKDNDGNTPIMLAAQEGKYELVKALEISGCSVVDSNYKNENCIHLLMKGKKIKRCNKKMLKYLISNGVNLNEIYEEPIYNSESESQKYQCTTLIHIIRTDLLEKWEKGEILDEMFLQRSQRINPNIQDSDGKDVFMHLAINNESDLCKFIIANIRSNYNETKHLNIGFEEFKDNQVVNESKTDICKVSLKNSRAKTLQEAPEKIQLQAVEEEQEEQIVTTKYELKMQEIEDKKKIKENDNSLDIQEKDESKFKFGINLCNVDKVGKSVIHYIVSPLDYGSYENHDFLEYLLKFGFKGDITDNNGKKPFEYAKDLSSDTMLNTLKLFNAAPLSTKLNVHAFNFKKLENWEDVDYLKDSQDYLDLAKMDIDKKNLVPCDPVGKFNDDCEVLEDPDNGYYDCHLTRVDIGREAKDDYLFYKLQIVHDKGRDLWMLFTRWGRIGEEGAFQKTPYSKEECIKEFESIFLSKTKNEWKDRKNFQKHFWKYQLININYSNVCHKDYLVPFDFSKSKESTLAPQVQEILREITQVAMYVKGIKNSGIDTDQMPFSNINRNDLLKARESLMRLREILEELEPLEGNLNRFNKGELSNKIISLREKCWYHSSRFYEMIPHEQFKNEIVPPINTMATLKEKADMIDNLINFEMASKILLGAHKNAKDINPLDYCLKAMGVEIDKLDKTSSEFNILKDYCVRTWPENNQATKKIRNIFKIQRRGEGERFEEFKDIGNRFLLYHGSRISNFMGICSQGLRVAPPEAPKTGYMFGKGVYFADMLQKSYNYCNDFNATQDCSKFMLLCEVAIGKSYKLTNAQYMDEPPEGYDSTAGLGTSGPCYSKIFTFPEGYSIPMGKYLDYDYEEETKKKVYLRHNEFIIYKSDSKKLAKLNNNRFVSESNPGQIKMRYLIQLK